MACVNGSEKKLVRRQRLIVVSMSLKFVAKRRGDESWSLHVNSGGLVSALLGLKEFDVKWIGWPSVDVHDDAGKKSLTNALADKGCIPVFLEEVSDQFFNGYCNNILWPLFHYLGIPPEYRDDGSVTYESQYEAYKKANKVFFEAVKEHYQEGDVVWCHDYHLMLLPQYLKEYNTNMKVGWFLHTTFPSFEVFKTLPSRSHLLRSVLRADLVGFQTYDFARHFMNSCTSILEVERTSEGILDKGRFTRVSAFPIGIEPGRFFETMKLSEVKQHIKDLKEQFAGKKLLLGVDRLDMIKGIPQKFRAFEKFLEANKEWRDKVVLLQIGVPTRNGIGEYKKLKDQIHEIVGRVNGTHGSVSSVPLRHLDQSVDLKLLCALYAVADAIIVTSLRDGMNLVSYEYIACQQEEKGVLIVSEFTGARQFLGAGALVVNPWNTSQLSAAIGQALNMSSQEKERRHKVNFEYVISHCTQDWAADFIRELNETTNDIQISKTPFELPSIDAVKQYSKSNNRLIILGFYGTLTKPMNNELHPQVKETLKTLCNDPKTTVVVLSGSPKNIMDKNFGEYKMWLAAENGMFLRHTSGEWETKMKEDMNLEWKDGVKDVFTYFTEKTTGSLLKENHTSLVWNYENTDIEFGRSQAKEMLHDLWAGPISNASVDVVKGDCSVEVHTIHATKGTAMDRILEHIVKSELMIAPIDYVLCSGYFLEKDEEVYNFFESTLSGNSCKNVPKSVVDVKEQNYFSATIGKRCTKARYYLQSSDEVAELLQKLADTRMV